MACGQGAEVVIFKIKFSHRSFCDHWFWACGGDLWEQNSCSGGLFVRVTVVQAMVLAMIHGSGAVVCCIGSLG